MDDNSKLRNSVLSNLRAVLVSVKGTCPLKKVAADYYMLLGEDIPYRKLGYKTLTEFVTSEKAFRTFTGQNGELMVDATPDGKSAHIAQMIEKQKTKVKTSKGRSRRFAPVRSNFTSSRMPSSQNNWIPQKLSPVKIKKPFQRRRSLRGSTSSTAQMPALNERLVKTINLETNKEQVTITYRGQKSADATPLTEQKRSAKTNETQTVAQPQRKDLSRENSTEWRRNLFKDNSTNEPPKAQNRSSVSRQASVSEVDLIKSIPKELLREVPLNDITFDEILDRTLTSRVAKSPSSNSTSTDSSSVFSYPEVTDVDYPSNPVSPMSESGSFSSWMSETANTKQSTHVTPRGRGRLMKTSSNDRFSNTPLVESLSDQLLNNLNIQQTKSSTTQFVDAVPDNSLLTPDNPASPNEQRLYHLLNELNLKCKPEIKMVKRTRKMGPPIYDAHIKIGTYVQCSTWPNEYTSSEEARESVLNNAVKEVEEKYAHVMKLPVSAPQYIGPRLFPLVYDHPSGIWSDTLQQIYTDTYRERLPQNWLVLATKAGIRIECAANEKFILICSEDQDNSLTNESNGNEIQDDLNTTVAAPEIPDTDGYLSVVVTCTNSTVDISFRIIGTTLSERYKRLTMEMEQYYSQKTKCVASALVAAGKYFAVSNNNTWMRVRVLEEPQSLPGTDPENIEVLCSFIDHGHEYPIPISKLFDLPYEFRSIPAQAIHCSLVGLEELADSEVALQYLEELVGKHMFLKIFDGDFDSEGLNVVLFDTSGPEDINVNLDIMNRVCAEAPTPCLKSDGSVQEMNVVYADSLGFVYLHEGQGSHLFFELMDKVTLRLEEATNVEYVTCVEDANQETLYLARYTDGYLYRCRVTEIFHNQNAVTALFIDYGNTITINFNKDKNNLIELAPYSHLLQNIPPQCVQAKLHHTVAALPGNIGEKLMNMIGDIGGVLVKVIVPADKPTQLPVVELFRRSADESLYSINKALGLFMREPKIENGNTQSDKKKTDFSSHYDLSKFPSNSSFPSTGDLPKPNLPKVGTYFDVNIPSAVNPWNFFIQPYVDGRELKDWMFALQDYYNNGPGSKKVNLTLEDIRPGECYVAQHSDQTWYRACVNQTIDHNSISAFFVDYGQYVVLNSKQLQPLHSKFKGKPFQALKARLTGIRPRANKWQVDDCRMFQELVVNKQFVAVIKEIGRDILHSSDIVLSVKLIDTTTSEDIQLHKLLIEKGVAVST